MGNSYADTDQSNVELHKTLKSIDNKLSGLDFKITSIENKMDQHGKMFDVILRCLDKKSVPYFWDNEINLVKDLNSKQMHAKLFEKKIALENKLIAGGGGGESAESTFDQLFDVADRESGFNDVKEISDNFEMISIDESTKDEESIGSTEKEANAFMSLLFSTSTPSKTTQITDSDSNENTISRSSSGSNELQTDDGNIKATQKLYANQVLEMIGNFIHIKERKEYIDHYNAFIRYIIQKLQTDDVFDKLFKGFMMSGSYRDGLKTSKPDEFDTILRFDFGVNKNSIVEYIVSDPPHCTIKLIGCDLNAKPYFKNFLDADGYLLQDSIMLWLQDLLRQKLKENEENSNLIYTNNHTYQYQGFSLNGPAFTYKVNVLDTDIKFDIDLVPAIPFDQTHWLSPRAYSNDYNKVHWNVVMKHPKSGIQRNNRSFRCSYTDLEKHIMHDIPNFKNLIRIFKKFRDTQEMPDLKSYYIKTIFLWQLDNTTVAERKQFWARPLDVLFLEMLNKIFDHVQRGVLPFYWDNSYNMFSQFSQKLLMQWQNKIRGIQSKLANKYKDNPKYLIDIILSKTEKCIFERKFETKLNITTSQSNAIPPPKL